jgi:hypothetical protein
MTGQEACPTIAVGIRYPISEMVYSAKLAEPSQLGRFDTGMCFVFNKGTAKVSTTF